MYTEIIGASAERTTRLRGQTVVVIGGGAGIGRETARRARAEGADVIITGRTALSRSFDGLHGPIDHVVVTAGDDIALALDVARNAAGKLRPGGTLLLMQATGGPEIDGVVGARVAPFTQGLAVALAPIRVRVGLIAPVAAVAVEVMADIALTAGPGRP
jgi:hypothetical protein